MRQRGCRLSWRQIENGPTYTGDLRSHQVRVGEETYHVVLLLDCAAPNHPPLLPGLFEPVFTGIAVHAFHLRGFERVSSRDAYQAVVQEWHCVNS